jgi:uncharacterized membrane protein YkgB
LPRSDRNRPGESLPLYEGDDNGFADAPQLAASAAPLAASAAPLAASLTVPSRPAVAETVAAVNGSVAALGARARAERIDELAASLARQWFVPAARISIFVIYFWFGFLKLIGISPATPLASALVNHTIGAQYFGVSFKALALYECALGILFLIPAATSISFVLLVVHMGIVSSPLVLVASDAWTHPLVPTFEGQYIIKDLAIIALAIGILAHARMSSMAQQR